MGKNDEDFSSLLRSLPENDRQWSIEIVRAAILLMESNQRNQAEQIKDIKDEIKSLDKDKVSRAEYWWLRFLFLAAMGAEGTLLINYISGLFSKGHSG